jgi:hypothetical protein
MRKMKHIQFFALTLTLALFVAGCNGGPFCMRPQGATVTQTIPLENFHGVELAIASDVTIHKGEIQEVKITGAQNIIDNIERNVNGGIWKIRFDECVRNEGDLSIDITIPELSQASISGSGNITTTDTFSGRDQFVATIAGSGSIYALCNATNVDVAIAGSGDIHLYSQATRVDADIAGSGDIFLNGACTSIDAGISGSGSILAFEMPCDDASVDISGSGNCELTVANSLDVKISGSGNVLYKGNPTVDVQLTGSGTVKHVN